jgi:energy-converting hydrogenase Eha subunit B
MVNNVIEVVNYVIAARLSLLNFMIADRWGPTVVAGADEPLRRRSGIRKVA